MHVYVYSLDFCFALSMFHLLNTNTCLWFDAFKHMNKKPKYWLLAVRNVHWWLCWFTWNLTVKSFMTYVRWDVSDFNLNPTYAALIISILLSLRSCFKSQSIGLCLPFEIWICGCICLILLLLYSFCTVYTQIQIQSSVRVSIWYLDSEFDNLQNRIKQLNMF